MKTWNYLKTT